MLSLNCMLGYLQPQISVSLWEKKKSKSANGLFNDFSLGNLTAIATTRSWTVSSRCPHFIGIRRSACNRGIWPVAHAALEKCTSGLYRWVFDFLSGSQSFLMQQKITKSSDRVSVVQKRSHKKKVLAACKVNADYQVYNWRTK